MYSGQHGKYQPAVFVLEPFICVFYQKHLPVASWHTLCFLLDSEVEGFIFKGESK